MTRDRTSQTHRPQRRNETGRRAARVRCPLCGDVIAGSDAACPRCHGRAALAWIGQTPRTVAAAPLGAFLGGFWAFVRGLGFMATHRRLSLYIAAPLLINVVLLGGILAVGYLYFGRWIDAGVQIEWARALGVVLRALVKIVFVIAGLVVMFFTFTLVGDLVAAPFNDLLSEKTEQLALGTGFEEPFVLKQFARDVMRSIAEALKLLMFKVAILVPLLLFLFVPVVGAVPIFVAALFFAALDYLDLPMDRKRFRLGEKKRVIMRNKARCLGFGVAVYVSLFIPLVNLLVIPVGVVGGTLLFLQMRKT